MSTSGKNGAIVMLVFPLVDCDKRTPHVQDWLILAFPLVASNNAIVLQGIARNFTSSVVKLCTYLGIFVVFISRFFMNIVSTNNTECLQYCVV